TEYDGVEVESILIDKTQLRHASCQFRSGNINLPSELDLQPTYHRLDVISDKCGVGADRLQRARHNPLRLAPPRRRELAVFRVPIRKVIVPITHDLVHAATVHHARQAAHLLYEVTKERGTGRPHFEVVDVAVQGLVHSENELCHAAGASI